MTITLMASKMVQSTGGRSNCSLLTPMVISSIGSPQSVPLSPQIIWSTSTMKAPHCFKNRLPSLQQYGYFQLLSASACRILMVATLTLPTLPPRAMSAGAVNRASSLAPKKFVMVMLSNAARVRTVQAMTAAWLPARLEPGNLHGGSGSGLGSANLLFAVVATGVVVTLVQLLRYQRMLQRIPVIMGSNICWY